MSRPVGDEEVLRVAADATMTCNNDSDGDSDKAERVGGARVPVVAEAVNGAPDNKEAIEVAVNGELIVSDEAEVKNSDSRVDIESMGDAGEEP